MEKSKMDQWLNQLKQHEKSYNKAHGMLTSRSDQLGKAQESIEHIISINLKLKMESWEDNMKKE